MSRVLAYLVVVVVLLTSCAGSTDVGAPSTEHVTGSTGEQTTSDAVADSADTATAVQTASEEPQSPEAAEPVTYLLPDPERWVVVEDWAGPLDEARWPEDTRPLQLDFAPLDEQGVPQLGRRISISYRAGEFGEFDRQWGDTSSMGTPSEFETEAGVGRSVHNESMGVSMAQVWSEGTFAYAQTMDSGTDLGELAQSLTKVDEATWNAARAGAEGQRLIAVQAAMQDIEIVESADDPLPHWVFPEPWEVEWVTDMTIWTAEQRAQRDAFAAASQRPDQAASMPSDYRTWKYGFGETTEQAQRQFVPQMTVSVSVFEGAPDPFYPTNYPTISSLGLEGVISEVGGSDRVRVELGHGDVRVFGHSTNLGIEDAREFFDAIEFATDEPLDGFVVNDPRFQPIELAEWEGRPASWHAAWKNPDGGPRGHISVWRLTTSELRNWLFSRGYGLDVPDDIWELIAAEATIDFGNQTSYNASTNLLIALGGIDASELVPIELDDWIEFAEPVNTDPLNPR